MVGHNTSVVERAHDLEPGEHARDSVELSTRRLGIEMAADHDRWQLGPLALASGAHVAHRIDDDGHPRRLAPMPEQIACLFVGIGERLAIAAAFRRRSDLRHLHKRSPIAVCVNPKRARVSHAHRRFLFISLCAFLAL